MLSENNKISHMDSEKSSISMLAKDGHNIRMTGHITDRIFKNGELVDVIEGHNLVVNSFIKLIMSICKGDVNYGGMQYWAIGSGETSWDTTLPSPEINATRLTNEIGRVPILPSEMKFLTADLVETTNPTNILQIKHIFKSGDCNGVWREFGIFGGNATEEANSGILINKRHHSVITKTSDMSIERTMRFTLNLI